MSGVDARWLAAVAAASRAPSPHNAQPARWRLHGDQVQLFGDASGWLAVADPAGRDDSVALGMAWEGMRLALTTQGIDLAKPMMAPGADDRSGAGQRLVAYARLVQSGSADPLAACQDRRRCWRGMFAPASETQLRALEDCVKSHADVALVLSDFVRPRVAAWYDASAAEGLRNREAAKELYRFMRFSRRDARWARDGLAADCMGLGGFEARVASLVMRPGMLAVLGALGLLRLVVSEKPKVLSAARLVAIHADRNEPPFEAGRRWYRFWLALTALGFAGVPMSALADSPRYSAELLAVQPLPAGRRLLNVMRVGPAPATAAPRSARRPAAELLATTAS
jgi:nitroreductase